MKKLPYYRLWVADFDTDENVRVLDFSELGLYLCCLNHSWINEGLPIDPEDLRRALKATPGQFSKLWPRVSKCFKEMAGRLVNPRQEAERDEARKSSGHGKKAAAARWKAYAQPMPDTCTSIDPASIEQYDRAYESESESFLVLENLKPEEKATTRARDNFAPFVEMCGAAEMSGSEIDMNAARAQWGRLSFEERLAAVQGIKDRIAAGELADPGFRPLPQNYLKNRIWQRAIREKREPTTEKQQAKRNEVLQLSKMFTAMRTGSK